MTSDEAVAFAPASVGNVAVGFDVLGHSVAGRRRHGPRTAYRRAGRADCGDHGRRAGTAARSRSAIPPVVAVLAMQSKRCDPEYGFELTIEKGIPLGSGLGGSAASAVAAVVAVNALLPHRCDKLALLKCAMQGEQVASGALHVDNVAPSLYGGLVLTVGIDDPNVKQIPVPDESARACSCIRTSMLPTRKSRAGAEDARRRCRMSSGRQANLAGFLTGCFTGDLQSDPRLPRGRGDRAAAAAADPGIPVRQGGGARARARSAVRSPAPGRRCSPGASTAARPRSATRWWRRSQLHGLAADHWISTDRRRRARRSSRHEVRQHARRDADASLEPGARRARAGRRPVRSLTRSDDSASTASPGTRTWRALPTTLLAPFAAGDALARHSLRSVDEAFDFAAPLVASDRIGRFGKRARAVSWPDCAFKDFGARFLAAALERAARGRRRAS